MRQSLTLLLTALLLTISACSSTKRAPVEQPPVAYQPTPESTPVRIGTVAPAKLPEVQEAVKRVFKDAAVVDQNHQPSFLAGDFNGDASQDIAVVLRPKNLDELNQEYPSWLLRAPRANLRPRVPLKVEKDEVLLAVIHGYGANDWRDPEATQTFVLKHVVGNDLKVHTGREFVEANPGRKLPLPQGDLIGQTIEGTHGYLYYATSNYSWYDGKTFKGQQEAPGPFHRAKTMR